MTVQSTTRRNIYRGNGSTTSFPITFPFSSSADIFVFVADASGISEATSNFNISGNNVVYPRTGEPLADGHKITIMRTVDLVQLLNLVNQGPFFAEDIESAFDYLTYAVQQVADDVKRSVILDVSEERDAGNLVLPKAPNKSFKWNGDATQLVLTDDPAEVLPQVVAARDALLLRPGYLAVEGNITKIIAVADGLSEIDSVAENMPVISNVANNMTAVANVAGNLENIGTVASSATAVNSCSTNIVKIANVSDKMGAVETVNENMPILDNINSNMIYIREAGTHAVMAKQYAIGLPEEPAGHSAKWWAEYAEHLTRDQADWEETDTTKVSFIKNKPTEATEEKAGFVRVTDKAGLLLKVAVQKAFDPDIHWNDVAVIAKSSGVAVALCGNDGYVALGWSNGLDYELTWVGPVQLADGDVHPDWECIGLCDLATSASEFFPGCYVGGKDGYKAEAEIHIGEFTVTRSGTEDYVALATQEVLSSTNPTVVYVKAGEGNGAALDGQNRVIVEDNGWIDCRYGSGGESIRVQAGAVGGRYVNWKLARSNFEITGDRRKFILFGELDKEIYRGVIECSSSPELTDFKDTGIRYFGTFWATDKGVLAVDSQKIFVPTETGYRAEWATDGGFGVAKVVSYNNELLGIGYTATGIASARYDECYSINFDRGLLFNEKGVKDYVQDEIGKIVDPKEKIKEVLNELVEDWTFTLEDESTVTKKVVVASDG